MHWVILVYLILNTLFFLVNFDQRDAQQIFFQLSSVIVFACGMFFHNKEIKFSKLNVAIGVLLLAFVASWLKTFNFAPTLGAPRWYIAMNFIFGVMVYFTIIRTLKKEDIPFILKGLTYLAVFCVGVLALQVIGWDFRGAFAKNSPTVIPLESVFFQRSAMGVFFANYSVLLLALTPVSLVFLYPMYLGMSTAACLGAYCGMLFFMWFRKRIWFWVILGISIPVILLSIFKMDRETTQGIRVRLPIWATVTQDIFQKPLGHGLDSFANPDEGGWKYYHYGEGKKHLALKAVKKDGLVSGKTQVDDELLKEVIRDKANNVVGGGYIEFIDHPHNEYIWLGYEVGIQAWAILAFIFYFIWERFKFSKRDVLTCAFMGVLICLAVEAMMQFQFHISRIGHILPVVLGFFYITTEE